MTVYHTAVYILIFAGLIALFRVDILDITIGAISRLRRIKRKPRVKTETEIKREYLVGGNLTRYEKLKLEINTVLRPSGGDFNIFCRNVFLAAAGGFVIGALMQNPFLAVTLFFGAGSLPVMFLILARDKYTASVNAKIEIALNAITTSYLMDDDITKAIGSVLERIQHPIDDVFKDFLAETRFINANIKLAIERMKPKVDNQYFRQWCDTLIQCQDNTAIKYVLPSLVEKMSEIKKMQIEFDTKIGDIYKEYSTMLIVELLFLFTMFVMQRSWVAVLFSTTAGQIVLAVNVAIAILGYAYIIKINRPVSEI